MVSTMRTPSDNGVETYLNYFNPLQPGSKKAFLDDQNSLEGRRNYHREDHPHLERTPVTIHNMREIKEELSLHTQGFELRKVSSSLQPVDWTSEESIRAIWLPEVERLLEEA